MPLFDYICQACQHRFEYLVRNTRQLPPTVACPKCGSLATQRAANGTGTAPLDAAKLPERPPATDSFSLKTLGRDLEKKS